MINLTEYEKDALRALESKGQPESLSAEDRATIDKLKNEIGHGTPLDQSHPGMVNLSPLQVD